SRRRHTRFSRDWSSDVCSSDLGLGGRAPSGGGLLRGGLGGGRAVGDDGGHRVRLLLRGSGGPGLARRRRRALARTLGRRGVGSAHHDGHTLLAEAPQNAGGLRHGDVGLLERTAYVVGFEVTLGPSTLDQL